MNINELISIVKNKLYEEIDIQNLKINDKSFLHKNHKGNQPSKFHLKIEIQSDELKKMSKIDSNKKIYKLLNDEIKEHIHSLQILIY